MSKAVTLIELMIVISLMMILSGLAIFSLSAIQGSANLNQAKTIVVIALREAQNNSRAVLKDSAWGVNFENDKITIYADEGSGFQEGKSSNKVKPLGEISCEASLAGNGTSILFNERTGQTEEPGTITCSDKKATSKIIINSQGSIDY